MDMTRKLNDEIASAIHVVYGHAVEPDTLQVNRTRREYEGEYTLVTFPLSNVLRQKPEEIAERIGAYLTERNHLVAGTQVVKGFLNLKLSDHYWRDMLNRFDESPDWWRAESTGEKVLVEFASPNTNKPIHLGHIRNILLGWSMSRILEATGHAVNKVQIVNDRGIAICKSMLAWQLFAQGQTPESAGMKPDHFVGHWYVRFEQEFQQEYAGWQSSDDGQRIFRALGQGKEPIAFFKEYKNEYFNNQSTLGHQAREMLLKWEAGDWATRELWKQMNSWVYVGFNETYTRLEVSFDKLYYESDTWQLGKEMISQGLESGVFYRKDDGSVWVDLTDEGLDHKLLLRSDGTSVYITQDIGTAQLRFEDFGARRMVYVVADEQDYHFQALFGALRKLGVPYADGLYHLNYGMVDLPTGKMKSREGTVVDADDLMDTVYDLVRLATLERGEVSGLTDIERDEIIRRISMAALKFFILRVDPRKRMLFNPEESVDLQGQTGPYIQNAYVRVRSILSRSVNGAAEQGQYALAADEKHLLADLAGFGDAVHQAAVLYNPALVAQYCYNLAKAFHRYYHEYRVLNAETAEARAFRLKLIAQVAQVLESGMDLLGIAMPEKM